MATLLFLFLFLFTTTILFLFLLLRPTSKPLNLPPGPPSLPILGNLLQLALSRKHLIHYIRDLIPLYGPIFTLRIGSRTLIFLTGSQLIHDALIQKAHLFANRPAESPTRSIFSCHKFTVNSALYGPEWRSLRRNMVSNMLNPARLKHDFRSARRTAMDRFVSRIRAQAERSGQIRVLREARFAVFCILVSMCFGVVDLDEEAVTRIDALMKRVLVTVAPRMDDFLPLLRPFYARKRAEALELRKEQIETIAPLIERRRAILENRGAHHPNAASDFAYLDSLLELRIRSASEAPTEAELVTLCSEFLNGGTDTTATAIEWGVAELIDKPRMQSKIYEEIAAALGDEPRAINENDVEGMSYLQAFVKELLRKHPPVYFTLTHAAVKLEKLGGYDVPADANLEIYIPAVAEDPRVWDEPEEFKPERFLGGGESKDIMTGVKEIKMIPFGAGRRVCPGLGMGVMHITLMLGRMVQEFEWRVCAGEGKVDFEGKFEFTVVMSRPLRAVAVPRKRRW